MRTWIINRWVAFRSGFWFVPGLMLLGGMMLAWLTPMLDETIGGYVPASLQTTATTARATLTALCGAMFTVAGIVFSTTVVALSITSSQLGPRLLRNFLQQLVTQLTLGLCLATSLYCLVLLRFIDKYDGSVFIPQISLLLASGLGIATLMMIVYYIHCVANSMQAQHVVSDVANDLDDAICRLFPERIGEAADEVSTDSADAASLSVEEDWKSNWEHFDQLESQSVLAEHDGYLQAIDDDGLMGLAESADVQFRVLARPGVYLREGEPFIDVSPVDALDDEIRSRLRAAFLVGNMRTPQQDVECAVNDLVEVAVRALSPGINDPFTAMACIDRLSSVLRRLARRKMPSGVRCDEAGVARVVTKPRTFGRVVNAAFDQIRQNSTDCVAVTICLLEALESIGHCVTLDKHREPLQRQAEMIIESAQEQAFAKHDLADICERYEAALDRLQSVQLNSPSKTQNDVA